LFAKVTNKDNSSLIFPKILRLVGWIWASPSLASETKEGRALHDFTSLRSLRDAPSELVSIADAISDLIHVIYDFDHSNFAKSLVLDILNKN